MLFRHNSIRPGQKELIEDMLQVVEAGRVGFFEAPTGLGKTDASLAATLSYALAHKKKIFFITPKISQHKIVLDAIKGINKLHGTEIRTVDLVSKPNLCTDPFLYASGSGFYELCEKKVGRKGCIGYLNTVGYTKDQKANAQTNVDFLCKTTIALTHDELRELCLKDPIMCPYEVSTQLAKDATVIVADVNHVCVPAIRQKIFAKMQIDFSDCIFIFDESHNLPGRLRASLSSTMNRKNIELAIKELQKVDQKEINVSVIDFLEELNNHYANLKDGFLDYTIFDELFAKYNFDSMMNSLTKAAYFTVEHYETKPNTAKIHDFFMSWYEGRDSKARYLDNVQSIHAKSLDPAVLSKELINESHSCIFMSATLSPFYMYESLLGIEKESFKKRYNSPFPDSNKYAAYVSDLTTKYEERKENIPKIVDLIADTVNSVQGNIAVFFPSYKLLEDVYVRIQDKTIKTIVVQQKEQSHMLAKKAIEKFKKMKNTFGGVLFAVVGGSFAEGVDFPGDDLIGIIVVGLPFPEPDYEIKALIEYYDKLYKAGWDYAYVFPTISKIIQAAGRAIRSETDRAFILFLDKRYSWNKYKELFPPDYGLKEYKKNKLLEFMKTK